MSSSSDESHKPTTKKGSKSHSKSDKHSTSKGRDAVEYQIKPSSAGPSMDTSKWPLLLKVRAPTFHLFFFSLN